jgi:hypothetical protein
LPWEIQLAMASGYAAYVLAYTGLRDRHRPIDVIFISVVFSLIATLTLWFLSAQGPIISGTTAFAVSVIAGIAWRKFLRPVVLWALRKFDISWADDEPSALATLSANNKYRVSQIALLLDDGSWLCCEATHKFAASPFGPLQLGPNGDVALYVTSIVSPDGEEQNQGSVCDPIYGDRITYVAASRIKQITLRHLPNASRFSRAEEEPVVVQSLPEQGGPSVTR